MDSIKFNATRIISASEVQSLGGLPHWQDLKFTEVPGYDKERMRGCGLYCISFDGRAIYVGKFLGTSSDAHRGNVLRIRWLRHIASLCLRGERMSMSRTTLELLLRELPPGQVRTALEAADAAALTRDRGFLACYNRALFAIRHWPAFQGHPGTFLSRFDFGYVRLQPQDAQGRSLAQVREAVSRAEEMARGELHLCCNGESDFAQAMQQPAKGLDQVLARYAQLMAQALGIDLPRAARADDKAAPRKKLIRISPDAKPRESEISLEIIEEDLPEGWPSDWLRRLRSSLPGEFQEVHATATGRRGDVRVRAFRARAKRNVFTMAWQPRRSRFLCRILLDEQALESCPGATLLPPSLQDPLVTTFAFDASADPNASMPRLLTLIEQAAHQWRTAVE